MTIQTQNQFTKCYNRSALIKHFVTTPSSLYCHFVRIYLPFRCNSKYTLNGRLLFTLCRLFRWSSATDSRQLFSKIKRLYSANRFLCASAFDRPFTGTLSKQKPLCNTCVLRLPIHYLLKFGQPASTYCFAASITSDTAKFSLRKI